MGRGVAANMTDAASYIEETRRVRLAVLCSVVIAAPYLFYSLTAVDTLNGRLTWPIRIGWTILQGLPLALAVLFSAGRQGQERLVRRVAIALVAALVWLNVMLFVDDALRAGIIGYWYRISRTQMQPIFWNNYFRIYRSVYHLFFIVFSLALIQEVLFPWPRVKRATCEWLARVGLMVAPLVILWSGAEVCFRLHLFGKPWLDVTTGMELYRYDPVLGWRLRPGVRTTVFGAEVEDQEYQVSSNSLGFRDREHGFTVTDRPRVVCVGDSFTYGMSVAAANRYTEVMERECGVECINLGVPGYSTDQEFLAYRDVGARFAPQTVVVQLFAQNDFIGNTLILSFDYSKPHFVLTGGDQRLRLERPALGIDAGIGEARFSFIQDSYAIHFVRLTWRRWRYSRQKTRRGVEQPDARAGPDTDLLPVDEQAIAGRPTGFVITREILREFQALCSEKGARLILLPVPSGVLMHARDELDPEAWDAEQMRYQAALDIGTELGIPTVDMLPVLRRSHEAGQPPYFGVDTHWNATGHRLAARQLCQLLQTGAAPNPGD